MTDIKTKRTMNREDAVIRDDIIDLLTGPMAVMSGYDEKERSNWNREADALVSHFLALNNHEPIDFEIPKTPVKMLLWWQDQARTKNSNFPLCGAQQ